METNSSVNNVCGKIENLDDLSGHALNKQGCYVEVLTKFRSYIGKCECLQ